MEDNNPLENAREALKTQRSSSNPPPENNGNGSGSGGMNRIIIGVAVAAVLLVIIGLFLPPFSLGERLSGGGDEPEAVAEVETTDSTVADAGASTLPGEVALLVADGATASVAEAGADFAGSAALPADASLRGKIYTVAADSGTTGQVAVTVPGGVQNTDDLMAYNGSSWAFMASSVDESSLVSAMGELPQAVAVVARNQPTSVAVGASLASEQVLPADVTPFLTEVNAGGLQLAADGSLDGQVAAVPQGGYQQMLHVTNVDVIVDQAAISALLTDPALRTAHVDTLVNTAQAAGFSGVNVDYQGVSAAQQADFTAFVTELDAALAERDLSLAVTLGAPVAVGDSWDTAGQDWAALGQLADVVYVQMPLDPTTYADGGEADRLLSWATRQVDRSKLSAILSANGVDKLGGALRELSIEDALTTLGDVTLAAEGDVEVGTAVDLQLDGSASPLAWDGDSLTYKYTYDQDGQERTVWISNEASLAYRMRLARRHHLRGVEVRGLSQLDAAGGYAAALQTYINNGELLQPEGAAITWNVENADGAVVASNSGEALTYTWEGAEDAGEYTVKAGFAQGDTVIELGALPLTVGTVAAEEEEVAEEETDEAGEEAAEETAEEPVVSQPATNFEISGDNNAVVNTGANVRTGPGLGYGTIAGGAEPGTQVVITGKSSDSSWYQIEFVTVAGEAEVGWIFNSLVNVSPSLDVASLPVPDVAPPVVVSDPDTGNPSAPPPPVSPPANLGGGFELGGQTHTLANPTLMSYAGMTWVKFQHKWGPGNLPNDLAGRISQAHANGFKVLLSIPGSPYPSSIDFNAYVQFLGGLAALPDPPDALEIWNEQNIDFEWVAGQIDPASYVNNMLAPAYNAIKAANPGVMVISGAPSSTGFFGGGCSAAGCDDDAYIRGMAAAGAGSYLDCVGVHYNSGATSPSATSGHPADASGHYSWYFPAMIDLYYGTFGKPLCFTELGFVSGDDYGGVPSRFAWASGTSIAEHAAWLAEAVSISANSGKVRMVIVFNVDFTTYGEDPQAGFAMIRADGGCPACETLRQVMGR